jgi:hypothetical protein
MDYTTILATKPGQAPAKAEKRTGDSKMFAIAVAPLLTDKEVIYGTPTFSAPSPLLVSDVRTKGGKFIIFRAQGGPTGIPYSDYLVSFSVTTSSGSVISVPVTVRAYE